MAKRSLDALYNSIVEQVPNVKAKRNYFLNILQTIDVNGGEQLEAQSILTSTMVSCRDGSMRNSIPRSDDDGCLLGVRNPSTKVRITGRTHTRAKKKSQSLK